jgi:hypothetical protein
VSPVLDALARKYVWWQTPDETLTRLDHFLCQLMTLGTPDDVRSARAELGDDAFVHALEHAPPGVMDAKSWSFWHRVLRGSPPPPLPERPLP